MDPSVARSQKRVCPAAQRRHGSKPRTVQPMIGSTTTRRPSSSTTPTTSWPSTAGKEANGDRMALACPVRSAMSVPHMPARIGPHPHPVLAARGREGRIGGAPARASSLRPGAAGGHPAGAASADSWPTRRSAAAGRAPIRPPAAVGSVHRDPAHDARTDPLQDLVQAVAGDGQAVILEADDGARRIGRLPHQLGHLQRQLLGAAG